MSIDKYLSILRRFTAIIQPNHSSADKYQIQNLPTSGGASNLDLPELPTVPSDTPTHSATGSLDEKKNNDEDEDIDFDDLQRRFEALKKKK